MTPTSRPLVAAVDVGGTTIKGGLVQPDGHVAARRRIPVTDVPAERLVDTVTDMVSDLLTEAETLTGGRGATAIGLAVPGLVDETAGVARHSMILGWRDVPFGALLSRFNKPIAFGHDVSAGAYAESRLGAARGHRDWLFLALGTGLGSTFVLDDRPYRGSRGSGGELAHIVVHADGPRCRCGKRGCLEMIATGPAIAAAYAAATSYPADSITAADVAHKAHLGDQTAAAVWAAAVDALAGVLAGYVESMNPSIVVVGGGLAEAGPVLINPLAQAVTAQVAFANPTPAVVPATHGADAGLIGVAIAAHQLAANGNTQFTVPFQPLSTPQLVTR